MTGFFCSEYGIYYTAVSAISVAKKPLILYDKTLLLGPDKESVYMLLRVCLILISLWSSCLFARTYTLPIDNSRLIGTNTQYVVHQGDTIASIANHYDIGFLALMAANPGVDPFLPKVGKKLLIPLQTLLPEGKQQGIVVNIAQLQLFYFRPKFHQVDVFPIGIGRIGWNTPVTTTHIAQKIPNPTWTPTEHIRQEYAMKGVILPQVVPAGANNPLGDYAMRLGYGNGEYLIHGTNKSFGVGLRVSSGCIRLFPRNIQYLFSQAHVGMMVRIINQPVQYSREPNGQLYLEVTRPLSQAKADQTQAVSIPTDPKILKFLTKKGIDQQQLVKVLTQRSGYPELVGRAVND
ncbi:L,D-transpeptidase family protein [Celerinatantimonas yamalensis]|uniref:L,D-transpeptidase family protein n=1 Tax=Celerinatantimonas yamalensis TaxID=559956 RepID=A0ABW9G3W3_9GAMM